jgi:hypothetical protein
MVPRLPFRGIGLLRHQLSADAADPFDLIAPAAVLAILTGFAGRLTDARRGVEIERTDQGDDEHE